MTPKRLLAIALVVALLLRVWPLVAPWLWPSLKPRVERLKRRADVGTAAVMLALAVANLVRGERLYAAIVAALSLPALVAAFRAVSAWWHEE